ncbi:ketoacyl-ACP synthase III family protein [Nocardia sp. NPDC058518]|uniref:ketoacyl-ACP synthase III family protein n=1 Tax=Nocardia sp. NPDC058518 TaxID=3346534 RepID=UPI0036666F95
MKFDDTYIRGIGAWLPNAVSTADAVADGRYDADTCADDGYESICIERDLVAVEMAVAAGRCALDAAGTAPESIDTLFHGGLWYQGAEMWPSASFVADQVAHPRTHAFDLQQQCNVGLSGLELAARLLTAGGGDIMVTTADRFTGNRFDRWSTETGIVYGDGAAAAIIGKTPSPLRIVATHTVASNDAEPVIRGPHFSLETPAEQLVLQSRFDHFATTGGLRAAVARVLGAISDAVSAVLADAGTTMEDLRHVIVPAAGRSKFDRQLGSLAAFDIERSNWRFAQTIGHMGASDQMVGLAHLLSTTRLQAGDRILLVGGGAGFTCTCVVLEWTGLGTDEPPVSIGRPAAVSVPAR